MDTILNWIKDKEKSYCKKMCGFNCTCKTSCDVIKLLNELKNIIKNIKEK